MDELIASVKKEVLVEMVKLAQKRGMAGSKGHWKEFLKVYDKKFGASLSDPSRRSVDSLAAFLKTFTQDDDLKFFKKVIQCHRNREDVEQFKKISPDNETAEQKLVRLTLEHPQYPIDYSFPSHEEEWLVIKCSKKSKVLKSTDMIAIDCEMVLCEDGTEALVKVCAVDRNLQDSCGRPQKLVKFALDSGISGTLCVCKIVPEFSVGQLTKKRSVEDDSNTAGILKKLRSDQTSGQLEDSSHCTNQCDTHLQEIERLKGELSKRDQEISSLNKIIAALARKQGL
ncbi:UNVERIFIED_CONTAM: Small RNA degrading nuclease 3 [Sesamum calycinum]|uniref:Small RNA degrading nuclease 3 n=1 Tax=Sesamum calycinum TaxID=2727403 RepID=A0AAW2MMK4_9LAMI